MKRSKRIVLEAPDGYTFGVSEEDSGELKIKLIPTVATEYSGNYTDPPHSGRMGICRRRLEQRIYDPGF